MKINYISKLDGLRAIAALMVVFFHFFSTDYNQDSSLYSFLHQISSLGQTGVVLFFVLSGFLITRILLISKSKHSFFKNFYFRRILRIFPLYFLFLVLSFYVFPWLINTQHYSFDRQLWFFSFLQNFLFSFDTTTSDKLTHYWSLAIEEQFYIFWPFIVYFFVPKTLKIISVFLVILAFLSRVYLIDKLDIYYFTVCRLDGLALGALVALLENDNSLEKFKLKQINVLLLSFIGFSFTVWMLTSGLGLQYIQYFKNTFIALLFAILLIWLLKLPFDSIVSRFLETKIMTITGRISFGLYVYHPIVFYVFYKYFWTDFWQVNFAIGLIASMLVSHMSYKYFEQFFLRLKSNFQ